MEENYKNESMVDVAYSILKSEGTILSFTELFDKVAEKLELTESEKNDRISSFYTDISLDGRLVNVKDNKWDLRVNQKYENVHMDINDVYAEMDAEAIGNRDREEYDPDEEDAQGNFSDEDSSDDIDYDTSSKRDI
ncbi:MAG: DNA-directed RNA polymerase subunit delta [bacterium]|nr:DNA-directed RNA polymerase subunit delta [bacterium]MDY4158683.1 DNA-directed RNA polymerase subunit delta [Candidatus Onthovivens sp.]